MPSPGRTTEVRSQPTILRGIPLGAFLAVEAPADVRGSQAHLVRIDDGRSGATSRIALLGGQPGDDGSRDLHIFPRDAGSRAPGRLDIEFRNSERDVARYACEYAEADADLIALFKTGDLSFERNATTSDGSALHILQSALSADYAQVGHGIDIATVIDGVVYVEGWIENGPALGLFLLASDASVVITAADIFFKKRLDVTSLIEGRGAKVLSHDHGFCAAAFLPTGRRPERMNLYAVSGEGHVVVGSFTLDRPAPPEVILSRFWEAFSDRALPPLRFSTNFIAPLIGKPAIESRTYSAVELKAASAKPRLSIVVPLYGEAFFIRSLLAMQQVMPDDYEWIFVCDDARIATAIHDVMRRRTTLLTARTLLILNHDNYGYAPSNNIGVLNATADTLLFMNSDVWIRSPRALERALAELSANRWSLLGFHLRFEDGSTQHNGMSFRRDPDYGSLYLAEHSAKGLPISVDEAGPIGDALAVTGALLMMRRAVYNEIGGFNEAFIKGDFEDADLCLRLKSRGGRIGLVPTTECFHLERQSIRTINSMTTRAAVTYCNCLTFNELWGRHLDRAYGERVGMEAA